MFKFLQIAWFAFSPALMAAGSSSKGVALPSGQSIPFAEANPTGNQCFKAQKFKTLPSGLTENAIRKFQQVGWLPIEGKMVKADLDNNGKADFAILFRKADKVRIDVIWDGKGIKKDSCDSDLIREEDIGTFVDDPCRLRFERFQEKVETGLLIRISEQFTYKFICRREPGHLPLWHNIGTPD